MITSWTPLFEHFDSSYDDLDAVGKIIREETLVDWPVIEREKLGLCLIKAWKGEYDSASEALQDVRATLEVCGRTLAADVDDELDGFDWVRIFSVAKDGKYALRPELPLSSDMNYI